MNKDNCSVEITLERIIEHMISPKQIKWAANELDRKYPTCPKYAVASPIPTLLLHSRLLLLQLSGRCAGTFREWRRLTTEMCEQGTDGKCRVS